MFEKLILNPYVKNALKQYMDKGQKNAQHLILSGPQGTGKRTCADILAHFGSKLFPYMTELPISAKQAYQISEQAHNIRGKKLLYTKHDFLELLFQMMKEGEL